MDKADSEKFVAALGKYLQSLCSGYAEFDNWVEIVGQLFLTVDTGETVQYSINERVCRQEGDIFGFISNSLQHSNSKPNVKNEDLNNLIDLKTTDDVEADFDPSNLQNGQFTSAYESKQWDSLPAVKSEASGTGVVKSNCAGVENVAATVVNTSLSDVTSDVLSQQMRGSEYYLFNILVSICVC